MASHLTKTKTKTKTKYIKDPTCAIFLKSRGFKDIKYYIHRPDQTRPDQTTLTTFPLPLKIDDCEFFGFQNFKKFHYWVRHAKCTWSS